MLFFFDTWFRFKSLLWVVLLHSALGACKGGAFRPHTPSRPHIPVSGPVAPATSARDLVSELEYSHTFWPLTEGLSKDGWLDHCTQMLMIGNDDLLVQEGDTGTNPVTCVACDEEKAAHEYESLCCQCKDNLPWYYCNTCLYTDMERNTVACKNSNACNKLLPYSVVRRACEGGAFQAWLADLDQPAQTRLTVDDPEIQGALSARDRVASRYLDQLMTRVSGARNNAFKPVNCTRKDCIFQALVEQNTRLPAVPCYFHAQNRICVQCNENYGADTRHQCREAPIFNSLAERRAANSFPCPNPDCRVETERNGACMHMTCTQCDHHWCWYCVWHFHGAEGAEDRVVAYPDYSAYERQHLSTFHLGHYGYFGIQIPTTVFTFPPNQHLHPYTRHCRLDEDCVCKNANEEVNPFSSRHRP